MGSHQPAAHVQVRGLARSAGPGVQLANAAAVAFTSPHARACRRSSPSRSHVFEEVEDERAKKEDRGTLDSQIKAITELLDGLKRQRGAGGGASSSGGGATSAGGAAAGGGTSGSGAAVASAVAGA